VVQYSWDFSFLWQYRGFIAIGLGFTILYSVGTILAGPLWARGRLSDTPIEGWSKSPDRWLRRSAARSC